MSDRCQIFLTCAWNRITALQANNDNQEKTAKDNHRFHSVTLILIFLLKDTKVKSTVNISAFILRLSLIKQPDKQLKCHFVFKHLHICSNSSPFKEISAIFSLLKKNYGNKQFLQFDVIKECSPTSYKLYHCQKAHTSKTTDQRPPRPLK